MERLSGFVRGIHDARKKFIPKDPTRLTRQHVREVFENRPSVSTVELEHEGSHEHLLQKLIPLELREAILREAIKIPVGKMRRSLFLVGGKEQGRTHPHDFRVRRTSETMVELFYLDPEHNIHERNLLFPAVNNLTVVRLYTDGSEPELAAVRYKTPEVVKRHGRQVEKLEPKFHEAESLIERDGVPEFLEGINGQMLFRMVVKRISPRDRTSNLAVVEAESLYTNKNQLRDFANGNINATDALAAKAKAFTAGTIERLRRYLEQGEMKPME